MKKSSLIMIPALACDHRLYADIAVALADAVSVSFHVVVNSTLAEGVASILENAPAAFIIAGTSYGGRLALELALSAPDRVLALWVMGSTPGAPVDKSPLIARSEALRSGRAGEVINKMAQKIVSPIGPRALLARDTFLTMANAMSPSTIATQNDALVGRQDRWSDLKALSCPSLWLWGENDEFSPPSDGRRAAGLLKKSRFTLIRNCGHLPSLEYPQETAAAARRLIRELKF
jgi:pimeloyl-ACP methyl ester carboxylesterase